MESREGSEGYATQRPQPIKPFKSPKGYYTLALNPAIGRLVEGRAFIAELTEDGILFRPADPTPKEVPSWLKEA
jgi:hypothetical protein